MVIERYRDGNADAVYERFHDNGRMIPEGVEYVNSWVSADRSMCYQLMSGARDALDIWISRWSDLVDFEVVPVMTSAEAAALTS
jgi:hypothetical protein